MIYLASPYSHPDPSVIESRVEQTKQAMYQLLSQGYVIFSPILMLHETCKSYNMPGEAKDWVEFNSVFLSRSDSMFVLCIEGWRQSVGIGHEILEAQLGGVPVHYVDVLGNFVEPLL
jgi:hypothetical protein